VLGFFNRKRILHVECNRTNEHMTSRFRLVVMCAVPREAAFTANYPGRQVSVDDGPVNRRSPEITPW
jgi:hypothetical protein